MPDSVLAAIIAGTATLSASFLQFRSAALRDGRADKSAAARRRNRLLRMVLLIIIGAAAVSGFALSQWLTEGERAAQGALQRELQSRMAESSRTAGALELTRTNARAEIETSLLRGIGAEGVAVTATVAACRPLLAMVPPAASPPEVPADGGAAASRACTEAAASPVTLCATIPANATITEVALRRKILGERAGGRYAAGVPAIRALVGRSCPRGARGGALLSLVRLAPVKLRRLTTARRAPPAGDRRRLRA